MVGWILKKILGSKNQRELKRLAPMVRRINEFDEQFKSLSDDALVAHENGCLEVKSSGKSPTWKSGGGNWTKFCQRRLRR